MPAKVRYLAVNRDSWTSKLPNGGRAFYMSLNTGFPMGYVTVARIGATSKSASEESRPFPRLRFGLVSQAKVNAEYLKNRLVLVIKPISTGTRPAGRRDPYSSADLETHNPRNSNPDNPTAVRWQSHFGHPQAAGK